MYRIYTRLLSRNLKINTYRTIQIVNSPVLFYGSETWPPTLREEHRLRVFENRVLSRIFGPKRDEAPGVSRTLHNGSLTICTPHPILCG
jgi:hypothetical protein